MSFARVLTDRVVVERATSVEDPHGYHDVWADLPGDPIRASLQLNTTYENQGARDTTVGFYTCILDGWPDLRPTDRLRDQHGRSFPIDGDLDFKQAGRLKVTVARLRTAADL